MKTIIAIVVTFKRKDFLNVVLDSLLNQTVALNKIIVIDNNSSDGTEEIVHAFMNSRPDVIEYYNTGANLGGAGGFARGFEIVQNREYDYLWLMDDDLKPDTNCLESLLSGSCGDIIQPLRVNVDGTLSELSPVIFDLDDFFALFPKKENVSEYINRTGVQDGEIKIAGVPFEGPLIKKTVVDKVGIPDKRFFIFYDDMDFSLKATKLGFSIYCKLDARATRLLYNDQKNDLSSWKGYFMLRNLFRLYFMHGTKKRTCLKPFILAFGFFMLSLVRFRFKEARICIAALIDSITFRTNSKYIP